MSEHSIQEMAASKLNNDNATCRVPPNQKKGVFNVAIVTSGFCIAMSGLFTGAAMAAGLEFNQAIIASVVGNLILAIYGGFVGTAGAREGVSTSMLARHSFGYQGAKIIALVLALTMAGWYAVQVGLFGTTINVMFPNAGIITTPWMASLWGGILMLLTAYFGYKGLAILSYVVVPLIAITSIIGMASAVNYAGGWEILSAIEPVAPIGIGTGIVLAVGSFAAGASAQADITRYAKDAKSALIGTFIGYLVANSFVILSGYITNLATGAGDLPSAMLALGLGFPALLVLIGAQWSTNDNNLYTSSLGIANILVKIPKKWITLAIGLVATILGALGLANYFTNWLVLLGIGIPPMAGIIIADYFIISGRKYEYGEGTKYFNWNILAFISWAIACFVGSFNFGIASINSLLVAMILYVAFMKTVGAKGSGKLGTYIEK